LLQTLEELERTNLQAVDRLTEIVQGLKAYAQAERPGPRCGNASEAIEQALRLCKLEIAHIRVRVDLKQPIPAVAVPDAELMQVVMNLVLNAAQALPPDGEVDVAAYSEGDRVTMTVTDNGPGIPVPEQTHIFDKFYRSKDLLNRTIEGSGLGLAMVQHIVAAHRGRVTVSSEVGKGTTFTLWLPAKHAGSGRNAA
jgi:two-component system phosphate regulon sensor histidine kinase PhoR